MFFCEGKGSHWFCLILALQESSATVELARVFKSWIMKGHVPDTRWRELQQ